MANINLGVEEGARDRSAFHPGLIVIVLIFLLTVASYIIMLFYIKKLDSDIASKQAEYSKIYNSLMSGNVKSVVGFQNRLDTAKKDLVKGVNNRNILVELEKVMIPNVYLDSYKYDEKTRTLSLSCLADNYSSMAKQILSFKSNTYFSDVKGGNSKLEASQGKIGFGVELRVK